MVSRRLLGFANGVGWASIGVFIYNNYFELLRFHGVSMYPFINPDFHSSKRDDFALLDKRKPWEGLQRGTIVAFWSPIEPNKMVGKRVIALEGDEVITRSPYARPRQVVPYGHVWVEGDNADPRKSVDSNWYGPIPKNLIIGKVQAVVWPYMRWIKPEHYKGSSRVIQNKHEVEQPELYR